MPLMSDVLPFQVFSRRVGPAADKPRRPTTSRHPVVGCFHQWLTDEIGHPKLQEHLSAVIALMKSSDDWADFERRLNKALPKHKPMPLFEKLVDKDGNIPVLD